MSKKLLSERQVRRFQKLAELSSMKEVEVTEEAEELEEGGLAYRSENIPQDAGKGRLQPDRIREEEEVSEGEEVVEEEGQNDVASKAADIATSAAPAQTGGATGTVAGAAMDTLAGAAAGGLAGAKKVGKAVKVALQREGVDGLDEPQMHELVSRIKARIMKENHEVQKLAHREQQIRLVEAKMAQNIERNRAIQQREVLTEALVARVVNRLKELKK